LLGEGLMDCTRCRLHAARHPRTIDGRREILCGPCLLAMSQADRHAVGETMALRREEYRRLMAEAKAEYDAWQAAFTAGIRDRLSRADARRTLLGLPTGAELEREFPTARTQAPNNGAPECENDRSRIRS
jgi:hypothetical protein